MTQPTAAGHLFQYHTSSDSYYRAHLASKESARIIVATFRGMVGLLRTIPLAKEINHFIDVQLARLALRYKLPCRFILDVYHFLAFANPLRGNLKCKLQGTNVLTSLYYLSFSAAYTTPCKVPRSNYRYNAHVIRMIRI